MKRISPIVTNVFLLVRMFCVMLESQHEKFCKPSLKVFLPLAVNLVLVIWSLECLLRCRFYCFPRVVCRICEWNSTRQPNQFLPAGSSGGILPPRFVFKFWWPPTDLFTSGFLSLGPSHFFTWQFIGSDFCLLGGVVTFQNLSLEFTCFFHITPLVMFLELSF